MFYNPQPASHLHVAIPKTIQSRRCRIPNLPAADVDAHRGRLLRRLRLVHRQQAHLRSCTNAATHPEDAVKLFQPLSWLSCWLFFFCFKTVSIHELSQDKLPRSTKVVSIWPMLLEKGRRSCYKLKLCHLLLISKGAQIVMHLSCWAVVIHNFKIECCTFSIFCPNGLMPATALMAR